MLSETERLEPGVWLVTLQGELDVSTLPGLERALAPFEDERASDVMVDLERVPFMDSSAVGVIIRTLRRLREGGGSLSVVRPQRQASRFFERTGLDRLIPIFVSLNEALARVSSYRHERATRERAVAAHLAAEQLSRAAAELQELRAQAALFAGDTTSAEEARRRAARAQDRAERARAEAERACDELDRHWGDLAVHGHASCS